MTATRFCRKIILRSSGEARGHAEAPGNIVVMSEGWGGAAQSSGGGRCNPQAAPKQHQADNALVARCTSIDLRVICSRSQSEETCSNCLFLDRVQPRTMFSRLRQKCAALQACLWLSRNFALNLGLRERESVCATTESHSRGWVSDKIVTRLILQEL